MAEIYYTTKISGRAGTSAAWSRAPGYPPLVAVALGPNAVGIYNEEGRPLDPNNENTIKNVRGSECMRLAWHPLLPLLAVGWKDGAISFWNYEERHLEEDSKTHRSPVNTLTWSTSGERLVSSDENGKLSMWKTDRLMRPIHVVSFEEMPGCKIRQCVLGPQEHNPDTGITSTIVYYGVEVEGRTIVKWASDQAYVGIVQDLTEVATSLIYYSEREQLIVVTASCTLMLLAHDEQAGQWQVITKMKFATGSGEQATQLMVCWACEHTLASASDRDNVIRMYNFETEDNYMLHLDAGEGSASVARIVCLQTDLRFGLMGASTSDGCVTVYKYVEPTKEGDPMLDLTRCWEMQPAFSVGNRAISMEWGTNSRLMTVVCPDAVNVCRKTLLNQRFRDGYVVMQAAVDKLIVEQEENIRPPGRMMTSLQILGLDISKGMLLIYDGQRCEVHRVTETGDVVEAGGFDCASRAMAIQNDSIYRVAEARVEVCTTAGTVKQTLGWDETQGNPIHMDICKDYLAAVSTRNYVRVYKVAGREAKPHAGPGLVIPSDVGTKYKVDQIRVNASGTMVSALVSSVERSREQLMFVYCSENNSQLVYDFGKDGRTPQVMCWDVREPKLLAVQTLVAQRDDLLLGGTDPSGAPSIEVALMFVSPDHGVMMQEYQPLDSTGAKGLIGLKAPHLLVNKQTLVTVPGGAPFTSNLCRLLMQGFAGMQEGDDTTMSALLDFSYHLATGNMDEAFRAVKAIKSTSVWENMAHLCIKNKRLDVAEHCLGKMENVRGARAAREARDIPELDARVATVAIHLGMLEDAKRLYISSERYDLLNRLYRSSGQWDKALEIADKHDRIHLKATHYAYAQFLEKTGDITGALEHYEASECANSEVPRMFFETGQFDELEAYIARQGDSKELLIWWARYCEATGNLQKALQCYERAGDALSMVRLHCFSKNYAAAEEQVSRMSDLAAGFHLARQYEAQGRISDAIRFYTQAKRYSHGVRLAKQHELDADLVNLALKSTPAVMIDAADYLNEKREFDKAATLYMKGGKFSKAVKMCFDEGLYDVLVHITDDPSIPELTPQLYMDCSDFFMRNGHIDKAVRMMIAAGSSNVSRALELCIEHDVVITEEMAEAMTPHKDAMTAEERNLVLSRIAKVAKRQGQWQLAAKKYTQAGEKVKAMKALLRSGDTEKVCFFASVSRQKEIYLMAANYLQTLDWHSDAEIMKNIISFYSKAQAMDSLASFYEACAQIEIDEYRDYEKALQAMREATKYLQKSKSDDREARLASVEHRISTTERFVVARQLITQNPQQALLQCNELLVVIPQDTVDNENGIRVGDVFALMVEYWYEQRNALEAYKLIEQMRSRNIVLSPYLDQRMVEEIYKALGVTLVEDRPPPVKAAGRGGAAGGGAQTYDDDEVGGGGFIEEEIPDEVMDD